MKLPVSRFSFQRMPGFAHAEDGGLAADVHQHALVNLIEVQRLPGGVLESASASLPSSGSSASVALV